MSRRPFCIVCSIKPHAFPIPSFSPSFLAHFAFSLVLLSFSLKGCPWLLHGD